MNIWGLKKKYRRLAKIKSITKSELQMRRAEQGQRHLKIEIKKLMEKKKK